MHTLATNLRPKSLSEILGQQHLISKNGILQRFVDKNHPFSIILFGPPGCGKTTLASALANDLDMPYQLFNASTGNKKEMDTIVEQAKIHGRLFLIIDEVHRLNKDKQDHLLPHIESGLLVIAGCTTANPYHAINPAIRSRCHILEVQPLSDQDIIIGLKKALESSKGLNNKFQCDDEILHQIAKISSGDIRFAYNCLEICSIVCDNHQITLDDFTNANFKTNVQYDKDDDQYYDTLSGLQKSIRGSDVNGAMYYFAKLIEANDIPSLQRRLITIAYEDIGLGNPAACARVVSAFEGAKIVGFPEARIIIANVIIDLCLSPKSKSAEIAIDRALHSLQQQSLKAPKYLRLNPVGLKPEERYNYDLIETWEYLQYLPDRIKDERFYTPWLTGQYEKSLATNYKRILEHGRTNDIVGLNQSALKKPKS